MSALINPEELEDHGEPDPLVGDRVNHNQICSWILHCEQHHGDRCNITDYQGLAQIADLKLIDVIENCIVNAQPNARYFALSYMWGGITQFQLTVNNHDDMLKSQALKIHWNKLPRVVQDAMHFVLACNERFLWVDALCIVQDDAKLKYGQIENMGSIYNGATATIVAGAGDNANAGLAGVSARLVEKRRPRYNTVYMIESEAGEFPSFRRPRDGVSYKRLGRSVKPRELDLMERLAASPSNSRAWTFQERMLSRRCIYFMENMIYFSCRRCIRAENKAAPYTQKSSQIRPLSLFAADHIFSGRPVQFQRTLGGIYSGIVAEYTRKSLTFDADALSAFAGITSFFGKLCSWHFTAGLPENLFDYALLWTPLGTSTRRHEFPSWSWAGWSGKADYNIVMRTETGYEPFFADSQALVSEWHILDESGIRTITRSLPLLESPETSIKREHLLTYTSSQNVMSSLLIFQAFTISFPAGVVFRRDKFGIANELKADLTLSVPTVVCFPGLLSENGLPFEFHRDEMSTYDLVFLSRSKSAGSDFKDWETLRRDTTLDVTVNVMLIEWKGIFAQRVALGYMPLNLGHLYDDSIKRFRHLTSKTIILA